MSQSPSFTELKFWNKKASHTDFMITAPFSLDNYFKSNRAKVQVDRLPIPVQFNSLVDHETLPCILSKKVRGVKILASSEKILKSGIIFFAKGDQSRFSLSLQQVFNWYLEYIGKDLNKALNDDNLSQKVIKPFLRIYSSMINRIHTIQTDIELRQRQMNAYFEQILWAKEKQKYDYSMRLQKYYTQSRSNTDARVLKEADALVMKIEANNKQKEKEVEKKKSRNNKNQLKSDKELKKQTQTNIKPNQKLKAYQKSTRTISNVKFKDISSDEDEANDDNDLCYELGLLISDTDRILKPHDANQYLFLHD